ncbi:MAG: hypothetical protein P4L82_12155 [Ancalomicrobiaceae bacterium]|nr:hypothetical protein [Ancalomicrobiaceae bacterium]
MGEFGHTFGNVSGDHFDAWGAGPFEIIADGKRWRFEDSDRFGPLIIDQNGDPLLQQPKERSPFWAAHAQWVASGRRVAADGMTCEKV